MEREVLFEKLEKAGEDEFDDTPIFVTYKLIKEGEEVYLEIYQSEPIGEDVLVERKRIIPPYQETEEEDEEKIEEKEEVEEEDEEDDLDFDPDLL